MSIDNINSSKSKFQKNRNISLILGFVFFSIGIIDFYLNNYFNTNITSFLPRIINFFTPLIFGVIGLHFIRIEFSGIKILDNINKNINTSNFNAVLSVSIILLIIFGLPPLLNWLILDANFAGTAMMQTGRAIEIVGITMATYLTISLGISLLMNWYNKRIAIQEK